MRKHVKIMIRASATAVFVAGIVIFALGAISASASPTAAPCGGDFSNENGNSLTTPNGELISQVIVKTGAQTGGCVTLPHACYAVTSGGVGSDHVTVEKTSDTVIIDDEEVKCQDISHLEVNVQSPTATPDPTATPVPTATPDPTATPTDGPSPTPSNTPEATDPPPEPTDPPEDKETGILDESGSSGAVGGIVLMLVGGLAFVLPDLFGRREAA